MRLRLYESDSSNVSSRKHDHAIERASAAREWLNDFHWLIERDIEFLYALREIPPLDCIAYGLFGM